MAMPANCTINVKKGQIDSEEIEKCGGEGGFSLNCLARVAIMMQTSLNILGRMMKQTEGFSSDESIQMGVTR